MKNIWILNHYALPPELGTGVRHYKFAKILIKKGYQVKIFAANTIHNSSKKIVIENSEYLVKKFDDVEFVFIRALNYSKNNWRRIINIIDYSYKLIFITKRIDYIRPDVIYASSVHPLTWLAGVRLAKRYGSKLIIETRDLWPEGPVALGKLRKNSIMVKLMYKYEKYIYKKADTLIFTMPGGVDYVNKIGLDGSKAKYINNGVDIEEFNKNKEQHIFYDKDFEDKNSFIITYTGSIGISNAVDYIVKAAEKLEIRGIFNIKILIYGSGLLKNDLEEYIEKYELNNIIFKGTVEKKYIPFILSKSDLNIITGKSVDIYKYGLSPNKLFDYFASGKPTLSNIECGYDIIEEYSCGKTVEGGSAEALAEGILKFYNMPKEEYNIYCQNALIAAKDFDFKILTDKLEKIILED